MLHPLGTSRSNEIHIHCEIISNNNNFSDYNVTAVHPADQCQSNYQQYIQPINQLPQPVQPVNPLSSHKIEHIEHKELSPKQKEYLENMVHSFSDEFNGPHLFFTIFPSYPPAPPPPRSTSILKENSIIPKRNNLIREINESYLNEEGKSFLITEFNQEFGQAKSEAEQIKLINNYLSVIKRYMPSPNVPSTSSQNTSFDDKKTTALLSKIYNSCFSEVEQNILAERLHTGLDQAKTKEEENNIYYQISLALSRDDHRQRINDIKTEFFGKMSKAEEIDFEQKLFKQFDKKNSEEQHKVIDGHVFTLLTMPPPVLPRNTQSNPVQPSPPSIPPKPTNQQPQKNFYTLFKEFDALKNRLGNFEDN